MEETILYAHHYNEQTDEYIDNRENWLSIYTDIHEDHHGNAIVNFLGNISITDRVFYKRGKHPRKIIRQEDNNLFLVNNTRLTLLTTLFTELEYPHNLLHDVTNVVITQSNNKKIKTHDRNYINGEHNGICHF